MRLIYRPTSPRVQTCRQPRCRQPTQWKLRVHAFNNCENPNNETYYTCSDCYFEWRKELNDLLIQYRRLAPVFCRCGWPIGDVDDIILDAEPYLP